MVLVVAGLVLLAFTVVALTGRVVLVRDRAGVAADQAALAAAAALAELAGTGAPSDSTGVLDRVACSVAGEVAGRNGGRVVACRVTGDLVEFAVAVTVEVDLGFQTPGLPGSVRREAIAGRTRQ